MSTLEDKLLGEKKEYYCSSSESDDDVESDDENKISESFKVDPGPPPLNPPDAGCSTNTGPKGVLKDWQQYKQIQSEQRMEREREKLELIERLAFTCRSDLDQEKEEDPELEHFLDPYVLEYSVKKMQEMLAKSTLNKQFGEVYTLSNGQEFLDAIDKENKNVTIIIHIYEEKVSDCKNMNHCLDVICKNYPDVKFCKVLGSKAGVSKSFKLKGVPALLVYKSGTLVGNFVKITEELGNDFSYGDVENFLIENGILLDKTFIPRIIRDSKTYAVNE